MQTINVITTGGTIEKAYSESLGKVLNFSNKIADFLGRLRLPDADVRVVPILNKDSLDMTAEERAQLVVFTRDGGGLQPLNVKPLVFAVKGFEFL